MIKFNKQKFLIALICTLTGWGVGYWMGQKRAEENFAKHNRNFGVSQFFGIPFPDTYPSEDSPTLVERFLKRWGKENTHDNDMDKPLSLFGLKNAQPKISTREDDKFVYMEIDLDSLDKNSISAKVENNTVIIEGDHKSEEGGSSMSSHFYQSFPVPGDTDSSKVDMTHENNKLVLKFPKNKR
jgi:HSP20 family molecular chaperone IbpA